jgi:beta-catenin-like protein 1
VQLHAIAERCVLLQEAELFASELKDLENIDDRGIKRVVAGLERRIRKNQELRMKHTEDPERFFDSESGLHELLRKLMALAGEPELYKQLVAQGCLPLLLELLQHANMDIVSSVVELLKDLTDADSVEDLDEVRACILLTYKRPVAAVLVRPVELPTCF